MPADGVANTTNYAVSGIISGFLTAYMGLTNHQRKAAPAADAPAL